MSQRGFYDHAYLELLKSSRIGESVLACQILDALEPDKEIRVSPSVQINKSRHKLSDLVEFCVSLLAELYFENTQMQPSEALQALWRKQTLDIMFRAN
jgi:hypothetical protein